MCPRPVIPTGWSWQLSDRFVFGWLATPTLVSLTAGGLFDRGNLTSGTMTLAFPDLGKQGNLLGFVVGMEPKVTDSTISSANPDLDVDEDEDTSLHIEGFYQFQLTDNIAITPGAIWITAPNFNNDNDDIVIGTIRTTFTFSLVGILTKNDHHSWSKRFSALPSQFEETLTGASKATAGISLLVPLMLNIVTGTTNFFYENSHVLI